MKFKQFLVEAEHPEDTLVKGGPHIVNNALQILKDVHERLHGRFNATRVTAKLDDEKEHPDIGFGMITGKDDLAFQHHITQAEKQLQNAHVILPKIATHAGHLKSYLSQSAKEDKRPSSVGYRRHLMDKGKEAVEEMKTAKGKQQKHERMSKNLTYLDDNKQHFDQLFKLHHHIQSAKNALLNSLISDNKLKSLIATRNGLPIKLAKRAEDDNTVRSDRGSREHTKHK